MDPTAKCEARVKIPDEEMEFVKVRPFQLHPGLELHNLTALKVNFILCQCIPTRLGWSGLVCFEV